MPMSYERAHVVLGYARALRDPIEISRDPGGEPAIINERVVSTRTNCEFGCLNWMFYSQLMASHRASPNEAMPA